MQFLMIASAVMGVAGKLAEGKQAEQRLEGEAMASEYNAAIGRQRAETTRQQYGQREEQQRRMARMIAGERAAGIAQSGTGFGGSNLDVDRQSEVMAELDALNIRYEGTLVARDFELGAAMDDASAGYSRSAAKTARRNSYLGAAGAALSGAAGYMMAGGSIFGHTAPAGMGAYGSTGPRPGVVGSGLRFNGIYAGSYPS